MMVTGGVLIVSMLAGISGEIPDAACLRATRIIAAGAALSQKDVEKTACDGARDAVRYDRRAKVARSVRDIRAGEVLEPLPEFALPMVTPGQALHIQALVGPVVVEREVVALQAAKSGERLFVQAADGAVFSIRLLAVQP